MGPEFLVFRAAKRLESTGTNLMPAVHCGTLLVSFCCGAALSACNSSSSVAYSYALADVPGSPPATLKEYTLAWGVPWNPSWATNGAGKGTAMRQLLLIRHGQYAHDDDPGMDLSKLEGLEPNRLTPLGKAQSFATGWHLGELVQAAHRTEEAAVHLRRAKAALEACKRTEYHQKHPTQEGTEASKPTQRTKLLLAQAEYNSAKAAAGACGSFLIAPQIRTMYVSNMIRAKQTAGGIRDGMKAYQLEAGHPERPLPPLVCDETLRERFPFPVEPLSSRLLEQVKPEDVAAAEDVFHRYFYRPEKQSATNVLQSFVPASLSAWWSQPFALRWMHKDGGVGRKFPSVTQTTDNVVDVVVMHSNMIRYLLLRALQLPPEAWLRLSTSHCSLTSIKMSERGTVNIQCYGSSGHLKPDHMTHRNTH